MKNNVENLIKLTIHALKDSSRTKVLERAINNSSQQELEAYSNCLRRLMLETKSQVISGKLMYLNNKVLLLVQYRKVEVK